MAKPTSTIELSREENLAFIAIDRDEKLNALSWEMMQDLKRYFDELDLDREIRAVILFSKSSRSFGVGADIKDWGSLEPIEMWRTWTRHGHRIMNAVDDLIHPVIAVVNGHSYGGSLELALAAPFFPLSLPPLPSPPSYPCFFSPSTTHLDVLPSSPPCHLEERNAGVCFFKSLSHSSLHASLLSLFFFFSSSFFYYILSSIFF